MNHHADEDLFWVAMVTTAAFSSLRFAGRFQVSRLKKELLSCNEDRDSAQLERDLLSNRFKHLESELESEKSVYTERTREVRGLEVSPVLKRWQI